MAGSRARQGAQLCPAARCGASRSPAPCCTGRACCCSTRRRSGSTSSRAPASSPHIREPGRERRHQRLLGDASDRRGRRRRPCRRAASGRGWSPTAGVADVVARAGAGDIRDAFARLIAQGRARPSGGRRMSAQSPRPPPTPARAGFRLAHYLICLQGHRLARGPALPAPARALHLRAGAAAASGCSSSPPASARCSASRSSRPTRPTCSTRSTSRRACAA